ncbi:MAG: hypothetical protein IKU25_06345 [Clostridia bacterium]|nr:hypothetical protein [Clostridia bacterium]
MSKIETNNVISDAKGKIENSEILQKIRGNKNYKWIKIGAIALVIIILIVVIFGGGDARKAKNEYIRTETYDLEYRECEDVTVKAKVVGKADDGEHFLLDAYQEYTYIEYNEKYMFVIVRLTPERLVIIEEYEYDEQTEDLVKELALNMLEMYK